MSNIEFLQKDVLNKILTICINDFDNIKQASNVMCQVIKNKTIPYMIGDFLGKLDKNILNMIFVECYRIDEGTTVSNLRRTCKYIDRFIDTITASYVLRIMEEKKQNILNGTFADNIKNVVSPMIVQKQKDYSHNAYLQDDDDYEYDEYEGDLFCNQITKKCKLCNCLSKNRFVLCDKPGNQNKYYDKIYCHQCFLHKSFIIKITPPQFNEHTLEVYATNYNVLRIMSGMGGLSYVH